MLWSKASHCSGFQSAHETAPIGNSISKPTSIALAMKISLLVGASRPLFRVDGRARCGRVERLLRVRYGTNRAPQPCRTHDGTEHLEVERAQEDRSGT